jgi:hypothetical protein
VRVGGLVASDGIDGVLERAVGNSHQNSEEDLISSMFDE